MSLNPLKWFAWLFAEWAPASVLRERLGLAHDRIAELERKQQEETLVLKRKHAQEVVDLKHAHEQEMRRLTQLYASSRGIQIPESIRRQYGQDGESR